VTGQRAGLAEAALSIHSASHKEAPTMMSASVPTTTLPRNTSLCLWFRDALAMLVNNGPEPTLIHAGLRFRSHAALKSAIACSRHAQDTEKIRGASR
jgi:hypothetical protein